MKLARSFSSHLLKQLELRKIQATQFHTSRICETSSSKPAVHVFNTLSKRKEPLAIGEKNVIYWYSCGPTVYDSAHIGHASSYVNFDIIYRILTRHFQINVIKLMNITDIDDKIIRKATQEKKSYQEISRAYEKEFLEDLKLLNCERPRLILRVTEHIPQIISFIQRLIASGQAYVAESGSVYFDTQRLKSSIQLFNSPADTEAEFDSKENKEKRHPFDFALWKGRDESLNEPSWATPWSQKPGRPGWHVECSTLASIAFGSELDIHSGGKDLIFPHHQNELIQCCAFHNQTTWSNLWIHAGHLHLKNDVKMSKSLSNTVSIRQLLAKYTSDQFRMFCLLSHYRYDKEFSEEKMEKAVNMLNSFNSFLGFCRSYSNKQLDIKRLVLNEKELFERLNQTRESVGQALSDDFNTNLALESLYDLVALVNKIFQAASSEPNEVEHQDADLNRHYGCIMSIAAYVENTLELFGLSVSQVDDLSQNSRLNVNEVIDASLRFRAAIRNMALSKDVNLSKEVKSLVFKYCDEFRQDLRQANVEFKDHKSQTIWQIKQ